VLLNKLEHFYYFLLLKSYRKNKEGSGFQLNIKMKHLFEFKNTGVNELLKLSFLFVCN